MCEAFVVMPFSEDFDGVYEGIEECLESHGFQVERADTRLTQGSILKDVIVPLDTFDLVVADLTGLNANVMYELGIAHALDKPVILISQSKEDLPFDLDKYRVMEYSPKIGRRWFGKFLEELGDRIEDIDNIEFGSPISDYLEGHSDPTVDCKKHTSSEEHRKRREATEAETPPGYFDNAAEVNEGFHELVVSFEKMGEAVTRMGDRARKATRMIEEAKQYEGPELIRRAQIAAGVAASGLKIFREESREQVSSLDERWVEVDRAVQGVIEWEKEHAGAGDQGKLEESARNSEVAQEAAERLLPTLVDLRDSIRGVHGLNRALTREVDETTAELDRLIALVQEIARTLGRARAMIGTG